MSGSGYTIDASSSTWLAIKSEADNILRTLHTELASLSIDPRRADQIRGEINGLRRILALGAKPDKIEVVEPVSYT